MTHYDYTTKLHAVWEKAVAAYRAGQRGADTFFRPEETAFLASIGATAQEVYDFAEDYVASGEPDYTTFAALADIRRRYFLEVQRGQRSGQIVASETLPPKSEAVDGIVWLPRLLPKAHAKLKGEMNPDLMYGCGGDRRFFREHDIHPAEFLRLVEANLDDDAAVIEWVKARSPAVASA